MFLYIVARIWFLDRICVLLVGLSLVERDIVALPKNHFSLCPCNGRCNDFGQKNDGSAQEQGCVRHKYMGWKRVWFKDKTSLKVDLPFTTHVTDFTKSPFDQRQQQKSWTHCKKTVCNFANEFFTCARHVLEACKSIATKFTCNPVCIFYTSVYRVVPGVVFFSSMGVITNRIQFFSHEQ